MASSIDKSEQGNSAGKKLSFLLRLTALFEFARYFILSFIALGVDIGFFSLLTNIYSVPYLIANPIAVLAGLLVIYFGSVFWVFKHRRVDNRWLEFFGFAAIGVGGLLVNQLFLWGIVELVTLGTDIAKAGAAIASFLFNFTVRKLLLFS